VRVVATFLSYPEQKTHSLTDLALAILQKVLFALILLYLPLPKSPGVEMFGNKQSIGGA
jgi:hypothetical protein